MSDTTPCPSCGASVPATAAFCTSCGTRLAPAAPPAPAPVDPTAVGTPGLHDPTQVQPGLAHPAPPAPPPGPISSEPPLEAPSAEGTWGPTQSASVPSGPPTTAPWNPPAAPAAPSWQQPVPPPEQQAWAGPGGMAPATVYGTAAVPAGAATAGATASSRSLVGGLIAIVGAALTIFGVFSGWVELGDTGTVSGWSLTEGEGLLKSNDPYLLVGLATAALVGGLLLLVGVARTVVRIAVVLLGLTIVGVTILNWLSIASFIEDNLPSSFEATAAIGFYLAIAGGVVTAIGGLLPASKK